MSPVRQCVLDDLRLNPQGQTSTAMAVKLGMPQCSLYWHLRRLNIDGKCGPTAAGGQALWALREHLPAVKARIQAELDASQRRTDVMLRKRRLQRREAIANERFLQSHKRVVSASQCEPLRPTGPISVFHLAA